MRTRGVCELIYLVKFLYILCWNCHCCSLVRLLAHSQISFKLTIMMHIWVVKLQAGFDTKHQNGPEKKQIFIFNRRSNVLFLLLSSDSFILSVKKMILSQGYIEQCIFFFFLTKLKHALIWNSKRKMWRKRKQQKQKQQQQKFRKTIISEPAVKKLCALVRYTTYM